MTFSADGQGPKFRLFTQVTSKKFRLRLRRGQICRKLNPCALFGVRDNAITLYADVRGGLKIFVSLISRTQMTLYY